MGFLCPRGPPDPAHGGHGPAAPEPPWGPRCRIVGMGPEPPTALRLSELPLGGGISRGGRGFRAGNPPTALGSPRLLLGDAGRGFRGPHTLTELWGCRGGPVPSIPPVYRLGWPWEQSRGLWSCCSSPAQPDPSPAALSREGGLGIPPKTGPSSCPVPRDPPERVRAGAPAPPPGQ